MVTLLRIFAKATVFVCVVIFSILAVLFGTYGYSVYFRSNENAGLAQELFEGRLPFDQVLQSLKWHPSFTLNWDCTYAIVQLSDSAPEMAPSWNDHSKGRRFHFGGDWKATPITSLGKSSRDAVGHCAKNWPADLHDRITRAIHEPGSWAIRGPVGETVFVYSIPQKIAAKIRFGD